MAARQFLRLAIDLAGELAEGDDRTGEGDRTNEDAEENLDLQDVELDRRLVGKDRGKAMQAGMRGVTHGSDICRLEMSVVADEDGCETDERMHGRDELRHFRHLHALSDHPAERATGGDQQDGQQPVARTRTDQGGENRQPHAGDPVPDGALGAFLARQTSERKNEQYRSNDVGGRSESEIHSAPLLTTSGTWQACAG